MPKHLSALLCLSLVNLLSARPDRDRQAVKSDPRPRLHAVRHTDNQGSLESNMKLSRDRAATNLTEAGRAKNRRVALVAQ